MTKSVINVLIGLALFFGGFIASKHYYNQNTSQTTETEENHIVTIIVEKKKPNGEVEKVTKIDQRTKDTTKTVVTTALKSKVNLSVLAANSTSHLFSKPTYGLSVSKEVIGPITVGVFGFTDKTVGISIGVNF